MRSPGPGHSAVANSTLPVRSGDGSSPAAPPASSSVLRRWPRPGLPRRPPGSRTWARTPWVPPPTPPGPQGWPPAGTTPLMPRSVGSWTTQPNRCASRYAASRCSERTPPAHSDRGSSRVASSRRSSASSRPDCPNPPGLGPAWSNRIGPWPGDLEHLVADLDLHQQGAPEHLDIGRARAAASAADLHYGHAVRTGDLGHRRHAGRGLAGGRPCRLRRRRHQACDALTSFRMIYLQ